MILLDTDHLSVVANSHGAAHAGLMARVQASGESSLGTTIVSVEEQCRGWLAQIRRLKVVRDQVSAYGRLRKLFTFLADWEIVSFDDPAVDEYERLRKQRVRIGAQDLKIASIALVLGTLPLSANLRDFRQVPGLRVENWLE